MYIRGGTVHKTHVSVCITVLVLRFWFCTVLVIFFLLIFNPPEMYFSIWCKA